MATLWSLDMPAYLIVEHTITDPAKFQEYGDKVRPLVANYGGRSLARGSHRVLETNHWLPDRVILFEFPDMEALNTMVQLARVPASYRSPAIRNRHEQGYDDCP
jgi:uncharacterized protein (DUF1330 family)